MVTIVKFDTETYNLTKNLGTPVYSLVEEEIPELEIITDAEGNPTRGGIIGYCLASATLVGLLAYLYWAI